METQDTIPKAQGYEDRTGWGVIERISSFNLQFVNFRRRPTCNLWKDKPSHNNGDGTSSREAGIRERESVSAFFFLFGTFQFPCIMVDSSSKVKGYSQESSFDTPWRGTIVDHQWGAEAEHYGDEI